MKLNKLTERFDAILALQNKQKKHPSGTYLSDIYEKATDLALNPERKIDEYLMRNLVRDAKIILKRDEQKSAIKNSIQIDVLESMNFEDRFVDFVDPEYQWICNESLEQIRDHCRFLHEHAESILYGLIDGKTGAQIALELSITESKVKRLRLEIKVIVNTILFN